MAIDRKQLEPRGEQATKESDARETAPPREEPHPPAPLAGWEAVHGRKSGWYYRKVR